MRADAMWRLTDEVLRGRGDGSGALSASETRGILIQRSYVKQFRGAPFDTESAELVPVRLRSATPGQLPEREWGGACQDCPYNSANMPEAGEHKFPFCTMPTCFLAKQEAHVEQTKTKAVAAGALVVMGEEAARFIHHDGAPKVESGMVDLDATPLPGEVVSQKNLKTWREMLAGEATAEIVVDRVKNDAGKRTEEPVRGTVTGKLTVKPTVVFDDKGRAHWLAPRTQAIEAAKKNGFESVFASSSKGSGSNSTHSAGSGQAKKDSGEAKRKADEKAKGKLASASGGARGWKRSSWRSARRG